MKKVIPVFILAALLIFCFLPSQLSYQTTTTTTDTDSIVIQTTTYVDAGGRIVLAADKGYATYRKTIRDKLTVLEEYLGISDEPVMLAAGYSAVKREYEEGLNTTITYLGLDGQPVVINNGYDTIRRTFNNLRLADTDTYFVSGEQVIRNQGYASRHRIYGTGADAKRIVRQEYRDLNGDLVLNSSGYAYLTRSYNSIGKVETERYYGTDDEPVAIGSGYYGYHRTYDEEGRVTSTTYLGADGEPQATKNGYATIKNIYTASEVKNLYFDENDVATTGTHGEYGYKLVDGKKVYLDVDGEPLRRLDIFLNSNPVAVLLLGIVFTLLALTIPGRRLQVVFLIFYLGFVWLMTLAWREGIDSVKGELFWSYKQFFINLNLRREIINNVFLFIPLGVIITRVLGRNKMWIAVLICLAVSAVVETTQLIGKMGSFEFDDMISNGIGGVIGSVIAVTVRSHRPVNS